MAIKTQGTEMYFIDPADNSVNKVDANISIDGIDSTIEQIETTPLDALARTYVSGLATPGAASFGINIDPANAAHLRLHQLKTAGTSINWAIGWSENPGAVPTADSDGAFVIDDSRSWITFTGFMNSFPFAFAQNTVVQSTIGIQISGDPVLIPKSTT